MAMMKGGYAVSPLGLAAADKLMKQGFEFPSIPEEIVTLPVDLSDLDAKDLMAHFSLLTSWVDYAEAQVGLAVVKERECERALDIAEAEAWRDMPKSSVSAAKALIALNDTVQEKKVELDTAHAYRRLVTGLSARYERDAAVLSRELTRRTSEYSPKTARRERWST